MSGRKSSFWSNLKKFCALCGRCYHNFVHPEEHLERLRLVFGRFREHNLEINADKCDFLNMKYQFFGHIVSRRIRG